MKKPEAVMEILEAYDLTGSFRAAAGLVGCDHKTVAYCFQPRWRGNIWMLRIGSGKRR